MARRTGAVGAVVGQHLPVPHAAHHATGLVPVDDGLHVAIVQPALLVDVLRGVDVHEVKHIDDGPLACPLVYVLSLAGVPVDVGHHTRYGLFAIEAEQRLVQLASFWRSLRIDGLLHDSLLACMSWHLSQ